MTAIKRIKLIAREDRKVAPRIERVAETNALLTMASIDLTASERRLMDFLIGNGGTYAANQWSVTKTLRMTRRTLSRAQRSLCRQDLVDLRYDGKRTRYRIRVKGVEMALKSASSKGCATNGASIDSIGKDRKKDSGGSDFPSALPTSCPPPPGVPPAEVSAVPPGEGNPRPITRQASERVWTEAEVLGRRATPEHLGFACARGPEARETYAVLGDRLAGAWKRATGYRWTRVDHKNVRDHIAPLDDPEGFLEFVLSRWDDIVAAEFYYRTESPAPPAPILQFLIRYRETFLVAWGTKADLDERAEEGRSKRTEMLGGDYLNTILFERTDRKIVEYFINRQDEYNKAGVDAAVEAADRMAAVYEGSPHAARAVKLFLGYEWWNGDADPALRMRYLLSLAEYVADDESEHGEHPCPVLALEIWFIGDIERGPATWLARRLGEEYQKADRQPYWNADRAALAADGVSNIAEAVELSRTKDFRRARGKEQRAAEDAGTGEALFDDQMRTIWDRYETELREQYDER